MSGLWAGDWASAAPSPGRDSGAAGVLIVPGLNGSGEDHWQTLWQDAVPGARRVEQADWARPRLAAWRKPLAHAVTRRPGAVVVAHSLGCVLTAHLAREAEGAKIGAALLVAPADVDGHSTCRYIAADFRPMPLSPLPFPAIVVASRDDPFVSFERAQDFAAAWGARLVDVGRAGHINAASGLGLWDEGLALLDDLQRGFGGRVNM